MAVDVESNYMLNAIPYLGKDEARATTQRLFESVGIKIMEPYLAKGRNVTTDNFFSSFCHAAPEKNDVTCRDPEQNSKTSSVTGKSFTANSCK